MSAEQPARWLKAGLAVSCLVALLPIVLRISALVVGPSDAWAFALPAHLSPVSALAAILVPVAIVALWFGSGSGASFAHSSTTARSKLLFVLPAVVIPAVVLTLPDSTGFMGDYLLRQGAVLAGNYADTFPQSLSLDRLVQGTIVPFLGAAPGLNQLPGARWVGLAACIALTLLSGRALASVGANAVWTGLGILVLAGGGYLCIMTGYARDWVELLPLIVLFLATLRERVVGSSRLSPLPELALAAMLLLHRSAICQLPAYLIATIAPLRVAGGTSRVSTIWVFGVGALCAVALVIGPQYFSILSTFDLPRHAPWLASGAALGPPATDGSALWSAFNALMMLAPVAPLAWLALVAARGAIERWFYSVAAFGWLALALAVRPQQGPFRDYDMYACLAVTLTFATAIGLLDVVKRGLVLGRALAMIAAISTLQASLGLLLVSSSSAATEARVRHGLTLTPGDGEGARAGMYDYLGLNAERREEWQAAGEMFRASAELAPSQVRLVRASRASALAGEWTDARELFSELLARDSLSTIGWCGYAATSAALDDTAASRQAEARLLELCRSRSRREAALGLLRYAPELDESGRLRGLLASPARDPAHP